MLYHINFGGLQLHAPSALLKPSLIRCESWSLQNFDMAACQSQVVLESRESLLYQRRSTTIPKYEPRVRAFTQPFPFSIIAFMRAFLLENETFRKSAQRTKAICELWHAGWLCQKIKSKCLVCLIYEAGASYDTPAVSEAGHSLTKAIAANFRGIRKLWTGAASGSGHSFSFGSLRFETF